jgi:hypothetical protein
MTDPILEQISQARDALLKKHGGLDGLFKYVQQLHDAHERERKKKKPIKPKKKRSLVKHSRA